MRERNENAGFFRSLAKGLDSGFHARLASVRSRVIAEVSLAGMQTIPLAGLTCSRVGIFPRVRTSLENSPLSL